MAQETQAMFSFPSAGKEKNLEGRIRSRDDFLDFGLKESSPFGIGTVTGVLFRSCTFCGFGRVLGAIDTSVFVERRAAKCFAEPGS